MKFKDKISIKLDIKFKKMSIFFSLLFLLAQKILCYELKTIASSSGTADFTSLNSAFEYVNNIADPQYQMWLQILPSADSFKLTVASNVNCDCVLRYFCFSLFLIKNSSNDALTTMLPPQDFNIDSANITIKPASQLTMINIVLKFSTSGEITNFFIIETSGNLTLLVSFYIKLNTLKKNRIAQFFWKMS